MDNLVLSSIKERMAILIVPILLADLIIFIHLKVNNRVEELYTPRL